MTIWASLFSAIMLTFQNVAEYFARKQLLDAGAAEQRGKTSEATLDAVNDKKEIDLAVADLTDEQLDAELLKFSKQSTKRPR